MQIVVMGVAGAGKTTIGQRLAQRHGWDFIDADDLHPSTNIAKMQSGIALNDADRAPWLARLRQVLADYEARRSICVLACSALKPAYRAELRVNDQVKFVYLKLNIDQAMQRVAQRSEHFMPRSLVASQFATLVEPNDALIVAATDEPAMIVEQIERWLKPQMARNEPFVGEKREEKV